MGRKSQAAVVVQRLLEQQVAHGLLSPEPSPHTLANKLVEVVWDRNPNVLASGGELPHKLSLAAAALSSGVNALARSGEREPMLALLTSLGAVLTELVATGDRLGLHAVDLYLVDQAESVFRHFSEPSAADNGRSSPQMPPSSKQSAEQAANGILTPIEVEIVHAFASEIGKAAKARGVAKFIEVQAGVLSIGLGFLDQEDNYIVLGSMAVVGKPQGKYECSIRGVDNSEIPGAEVYPDVLTGLKATQSYFAFMAARVGKLCSESSS
jgi:hypothetical protein